MFIFNNFPTCFGHHYAHLQENKTYVTACGVLRCNKRGKLGISFNVFFVWYCVVNLDGISCVYENVVCKLVCRGVGLVYVSCAFQVWCIGAGALMHELCLFDGRGVWCRCYYVHLGEYAGDGQVGIRGGYLM